METAFLLIAALAALALAPPSRAADRAPDLTVTGTMTGKDHQTYREVPFRVPAGVTRLTFSFAYTGREQRAVIDLGLRDPVRFRGWSGGNKDTVTIEEADATPSYLPGPIPAGRWKLVLGVPNMRPTARATYTAKIWFGRAGDPFAGFLDKPVKAGPGWYRGDLHMHTAHSDGSCASRLGVKVPCPAFKTMEAAEAADLDFIAVSDHNATSQNGALRELAPYFDNLLLIPGREITTFHGHASVWGPTRFLDFQLGSPRLPDLGKLLDEVADAHGVFSINHPASPSGENCMGCGWAAPIDYGRVQAVEVVNGGGLHLSGSAEGAFSGLAFWEAKLNAGFRITAVGGSDNHDASRSLAEANEGVGRPATVVHAAELSQAAILEGLRAGHVFIDVWGVKGRLLQVEARAGDRTAQMGDLLPVAPESKVTVTVQVAGVPEGATLSLAGDGAKLAELADPRLAAPDASRAFDLTADGKAHWLRVDVRNAQGLLLMIGNPIYLRPAP